MTKIKNSSNIYSWWRHKEKNILLYCWGKCTVTNFLENSLPHLLNLKLRINFDSAIPLLTIYPTDIKKVCARKMTSFGKSVEPKLSYTPDRSVNWYNHLENLLVKCLLNLNICIHCEVPLLVHALQRCRYMFTRRNVEEYWLKYHLYKSKPGRHPATYEE